VYVCVCACARVCVCACTRVRLDRAIRDKTLIPRSTMISVFRNFHISYRHCSCAGTAHLDRQSPDNHMWQRIAHARDMFCLILYATPDPHSLTCHFLFLLPLLAPKIGKRGFKARESYEPQSEPNVSSVFARAFTIRDTIGSQKIFRKVSRRFAIDAEPARRASEP